MRKVVLYGLAGLCSLSLVACGGKKADEPTTTTGRDKTTVEETTVEEIVLEETALDGIDSGLDVEEIEDDTLTLGESDIGTEDPSVEFELEPVEYSEVLDEGERTLDVNLPDTVYELDDILGYTFKSIRPMDHYDVDTYGDPKANLSYDLVMGDSVVHRHVSSVELEEPGYYADDPKEGPCWVEEQLDLVIYPKEMQETSVIYDEGEVFTDVLDNIGTTMLFGKDAKTHKVVYTGDREWTVFYSEKGFDEDIKDVFSPVVCYGYSKEDNGDYIALTLYYSDYATQSVDTHVPSLEERLSGAEEEFETILSSLAKK